MGNVVTYRSSWKPAPIEMETQPARSLLSLSLYTISFVSSPSRSLLPPPFSFCLSLSTSSLFVLPLIPTSLPPSTCQRIRIPLSPSFPNYLSPHRAPSYQLDSPGGLSILYPPSPITPAAKPSSSPTPSARRSRALVFQSPGLVSLTHARRIVMGNVQMH